MARQQATARRRALHNRRLRLVKGRPAETPLLDLAETVRLYRGLMDQARQLDELLGDLRPRILGAMERTGLEEFETDGIQATRQIRRFAPELDEERAAALLQREGRLRQAQRTVLDPERAAALLDELYEQGRIRKEELPYEEPREVTALVVRTSPEA